MNLDDQFSRLLRAAAHHNLAIFFKWCARRATQLEYILQSFPYKSSSSSEGQLIGRLKERMAADVLKYNSYIVDTYKTLCGANIVNTGTSGPRRGRVERLPQSSGIETLRSV